MWDGNLGSGEINDISPLVEREPMWDGNCRGCASRFRARPVEREPMWDGNKTADGFWRWSSHWVEREPMWDGNNKWAVRVSGAGAR